MYYIIFAKYFFAAVRASSCGLSRVALGIPYNIIYIGYAERELLCLPTSHPHYVMSRRERERQRQRLDQQRQQHYADLSIVATMLGQLALSGGVTYTADQIERLRQAVIGLSDAIGLYPIAPDAKNAHVSPENPTKTTDADQNIPKNIGSEMGADATPETETEGA